MKIEKFLAMFMHPKTAIYREGQYKINQPHAELTVDSSQLTDVSAKFKVTLHKI